MLVIGRDNDVSRPGLVVECDRLNQNVVRSRKLRLLRTLAEDDC